MRRFLFTWLFTNLIVLFGSGQADTDSLEAVLPKTEGLERIDVLHALLKSVWLNYPGQAMEYGQEALTIAEELDDKAMVSQSLRLIAGVHYYQGDYETSQQYNQSALKIALEVGDSSMIGNCYNNIGLNYYNFGSYQTSLEYLLRSIRIKKNQKDYSVISTTLNNIGLVYERVKEYEKAREYFFDALKYAKDLQNNDQIVYSKNNIGITYLREANPDMAKSYFEEALALAEETENINWGAVSLRGLGEIAKFNGALDTASNYYHRSLTQSKGIGDKKGISEAYYLFAQLAIIQEVYSLAIDCLDKSQELAKEVKLRQQMLDNLKLYAETYRAQGDAENEIRYLSEYASLQDSLYLDIVKRNLEVIPEKLKEERDRLQLAEEQSELQTTIRLYVVIILIVLPLILILIFLLRQNRLKNKVLQENNEEIQRTQKLLITSEKMASLGLLSAGIGHEINNPLNFIKHGALTLRSKLNEDYPDKAGELDSYFNAIEEGVARASRVVSSLSHFSRSGVELDEYCDVQKIIENCLIILNEKIREKVSLKRSYHADGKLVLGSEGRLHQAFINILSNAEQSIESKGQISISTEVLKGEIVVKIQDDGKGISEENLNRISDPFFTTKPPGEGTGLGLFITYSIIEQHKGSIKVQSKPTEGSEFIVALPIIE